METWSRRLFCTDRRSSKRFYVRDLPTLTVSSEYWPYLQRSDSKFLDTLALGGCGLFSFEENLTDSQVAFRQNVLKAENKVVLDFEMKGVTSNPIRVMGECVYVVDLNPQDVDEQGNVLSLNPKQRVWYYGVQFFPSYERAILPIISRLNQLEERGYVDTS